MAVPNTLCPSQVVLNPVEEWREDDGVRSLEDPWAYNTTLFQTLQDLQVQYIEIGEETKDLKERVEHVLAHFRNEPDA